MLGCLDVEVQPRDKSCIAYIACLNRDMYLVLVPVKHLIPPLALHQSIGVAHNAKRIRIVDLNGPLSRIPT